MPTAYEHAHAYFTAKAAEREAAERARAEHYRAIVEEERRAYAERTYERTLYRRRKLAGTA